MAFLTNKCSVRRTVCSVVLLILIAVGGGLILWQYLPQNQKETVKTVANGGRPPISFGEKNSAPPPTYIFNQCKNQSNCCNGLESICDLHVDDILYAGIHNSQSTAEDGFYIAPNHQYSSISALDYGYRTLNVDVGVCDGELALVHTVCELGTIDPTTFFTSLQQWMDANPTEIVLIPIEIVNGAGGGIVDLGKFYNLLDKINGYTNRMYVKPTDSDYWPTLRELIDTDKRIIMFHYNGENCDNANVTCPPGFHNWWDNTGETKFEYSDPQEFQNISGSCEITRGRLQGPFYALNLFMTIPSKMLASTLLNTRAFLEPHIQACSTYNNGSDVDVLFVDFWDQGNVPETVQIHNSNLGNQANQTRRRSLRF
jgi:uncharacterized protein (DUF779 family)